MQIDPKDQAKKENYKLLIGSVLPRPIAFVTTLNAEGKVNAAPFSFFTVVSTDPPMLSVTVNRKPGGIRKDTARNIAENREYVIHVVDADNVEKVNQCSADFPPEMSEAEAVGFDVIPGQKVKVPRIAQTKIQMECRLHQILPMGGTEGEPNADLVIGEVVMFHIRDDLYDRGRIDTAKLEPVGRLAGLAYGKVGETFSRPRPRYAEWKMTRKT
ncbi:flavin reductase (DIM6/NTAB) family NADH-FMN oxidoreductase RutF [Melghirimyces profundicolus]|uniref:Flavin reductase (DIM6/NTAB) family NADH-FMN oxidoreductase RutF n=1 Tax=Melghirimyces profundicolus TaxID=1242148 RepID=A0A2T6BH30_9BACL|nr:flavin reductase family protein [Melghirimyces profundicolus]PTX55364.1 flavin reductase (DIM6/NTAB) family NADH-FMN oxidoreductase RutF [Melghirimyces profundicolus]